MRRILWGVIAAIVTACALVNYRMLSEAYGEGPPYYGRSVNMDKWTSPAPLLLAVDGVALAVIGVLAWRACVKMVRRP